MLSDKGFVLTHYFIIPSLSLVVHFTQKTPAPLWGESKLTRYHPTFPGSSQSAGFVSSLTELSINAGTRRALTQTPASGLPLEHSSSRTIFNLASHTGSQQSRLSVMVSTSTYPFLGISLIIQNIPIPAARVKSYAAACPRMAALCAAAPGQVLPDGRDGSGQSAGQPAMSP